MNTIVSEKNENEESNIMTISPAADAKLPHPRPWATQPYLTIAMIIFMRMINFMRMKILMRMKIFTKMIIFLIMFPIGMITSISPSMDGCEEV